jgi:hypothetical protein
VPTRGDDAVAVRDDLTADLMAGVLDRALDLEVLRRDDGLRVAAGLHERRGLELDLEPRVRHRVHAPELTGCPVAGFSAPPAAPTLVYEPARPGKDRHLRLRPDHRAAHRLQRGRGAVLVLELLLQLLVGPDACFMRDRDRQC